MKKQLLIAAELIISLAIIATVLYLVNVGEVLAVIVNANYWFLLAALCAYFGINLGMSVRIRMILAEMGHKVSLGSALMANFAGMLVSDFTPARSGYFATAFALTANNKIPLEKSIVSILAPQLFEFMLKVCAGTIAIIYLFHKLNLGEASFVGMLLGTVALAGMLAFGVLLLFSKRFLVMLKLIERLPLGAKAYGAFARMQHNAIAIKKLTLPILLLLMITWGLKGVEWTLLGMAVGMNPQVEFPQYLFYLFLQPLVTMLQFIPTPTIAGMGVSEAGAVAILMLFGVPAPVAAAGAILTRSIMIFVDLLGVQEARKVVRNNLDKILEGKMAGWEE